MSDEVSVSVVVDVEEDGCGEVLLSLTSKCLATRRVSSKMSSLLSSSMDVAASRSARGAQRQKKRAVSELRAICGVMTNDGTKNTRRDTHRGSP